MPEQTEVKARHKRMVKQRRTTTDARRTFRVNRSVQTEEFAVIRLRSRRRCVTFQDLHDEGAAVSNGVLRAVLTTMNPETVLLCAEREKMHSKAERLLNGLSATEVELITSIFSVEIRISTPKQPTLRPRQ